MPAIRYQTGNKTQSLPMQKANSMQSFRVGLSIWMRILVLCVIVVATPDVLAKRVEPLPVESVELNGVRYEAPHFFCISVKPQPRGYFCQDGEVVHGGIVQAIEARSGRVLWTVRVYETQYDKRLEQDVQDIFITGLQIEGDHLVVKDEGGNIYRINLLTRGVSR